MTFTSPEIETDAHEKSVVDLILNARTGGVEVAMSDSGGHIMNVGLANHEVTPRPYRFTRMMAPYLDRFDMTSDVDWETGQFDIRNLDTTVSVGQQEVPVEWRDENPIAAVVETFGVWQIPTDDNGRFIQLTAYSPSIEQKVNMVFSAASSGTPIGTHCRGCTPHCTRNPRLDRSAALIHEFHILVDSPSGGATPKAVG